MSAPARPSLPAPQLERRPAGPNDQTRALLLAAMAASEMLLATLLFKFAHDNSSWIALVYAINFVVRGAFLAGCAFLIITWSKREDIARLWSEATRAGPLALLLGFNLVAFTSVMLAKLHLSGLGTAAIDPVWYWAYPAAVFCAALSLALVIAPVGFWTRIVTSFPVESLLSVVAAALALGLAALSNENWTTLSAATLTFSYRVLSLYESDVFVDPAAAILGVGDFRVHVLASCSGLEGIALVSTFVAVFILAFRQHLRFPQAFILFPIAIAASWLLNAFRISALISLGAHVSPAMAVDGFHSWAGWIAFLGIAAAIMYGATRSRFLWAELPTRGPSTVATHDDHALELITPLIALLLAGIAAAALKPYDQWGYALKMMAIGAVLVAFANFYRRYLARASWVAVAVGIAVGVVWQLTAPEGDVSSTLAEWFAGLPLASALLWLVLRGLGSVVLVPIAEELAFRGYLYHLVSSTAERLTPRVAALLALAASSVAFGLLHERWLAATLAGLAYGLLVQRSGKLADAIAAHMASNAVVFAALCFELVRLGGAVAH